MFGQFFREITGKRASDFSSLVEIDEAVEKARGGKLKIVLYESGVVHKRGNIFSYSNDSRDLDAEIDKILGIHA